jgi:hypothetical protein
LPDASDNDLEYQTKDTPAQFLDNYEIRADGSLWHLDYDIDKVCVTERSFGITDWPALTWKSGSSITMLFSIVRGMTPGGHFKFLHLWPGQIPPVGNDRTGEFYSLAEPFASRLAASLSR